MEPLPKASVLVASKAEYYHIVESLYKLGIMEAEVPEESCSQICSHHGAYATSKRLHDLAADDASQEPSFFVPEKVS